MRLGKNQKSEDKHLLGIKGKSHDPSSQRGGGRGACVGIGAFRFQVCGHLGRTNTVDLNRHSKTDKVENIIYNIIFLKDKNTDSLRACISL